MNDITKTGHKEKCSTCKNHDKHYFCAACAEFYEDDYCGKPLFNHYNGENDMIEAVAEVGVFEYGGYHFMPYRQFHNGEVVRHLEGDSRPHKMDVQYAMRNLETDYNLNLHNTGSVDGQWSYEDFYAASGGSEADIFICIENDDLYAPATNKLYRYKSPQSANAGLIKDSEHISKTTLRKAVHFIAMLYEYGMSVQTFFELMKSYEELPITARAVVCEARYDRAS